MKREDLAPPSHTSAASSPAVAPIVRALPDSVLSGIAGGGGSDILIGGHPKGGH